MTRAFFHWEKDEEEKKQYSLDFVNYMDIGESVDTVVVEVALDGNDVADMIDSTSFSGTEVFIILDAEGEADDIYDVRVKVVSDNGMVYVQEGKLNIW